VSASPQAADFVDLSIELDLHPGALAEMGEALGAAGVSVEGGGVFLVGGAGHAHLLVASADAAKAAAALTAAEIRLIAVRPVVSVRLRQERPGQLGAIGRRMADAGGGRFQRRGAWRPYSRHSPTEPDSKPSAKTRSLCRRATKNSSSLAAA